MNRGDPPRVAQAKLVVLKAVLSTRKSSRAQGAAGTGSAALKAFEGALTDDYKGIWSCAKRVRVKSLHLP